MQCGYFDEARREYVITDPRTPVKWINYIGSGVIKRPLSGSWVCALSTPGCASTRASQQSGADFR